MNNTNKIGYVIKDDHIKKVKKLFNKKLITPELGFSESWIKNNKIGVNRRLRNWTNEKLLQDELQFFGIESVCISKIQYV